LLKIGDAAYPKMEPQNRVMQLLSLMDKSGTLKYVDDLSPAAATATPRSFEVSPEAAKHTGASDFSLAFPRAEPRSPVAAAAAPPTPPPRSPLVQPPQSPAECLVCKALERERDQAKAGKAALEVSMQVGINYT